MRLINFTEELRDRAEDFHRLHPMLQAVFFRAAERAYAEFGKSLLITSMFRNDDGVHQYGRGLDVDVCDKVKYKGGLYPFMAACITHRVESAYKYDPTRPKMKVVIYGNLDPKGKHWNHIHFQVHDRTVAG